ncbi:hypothetical protein EG329_003365 [Mollisiaceae sp. DMI_Dod_QoI]|nr:hypothetical protein EG329_003365 [Helotiales sp. DMI_Dod_QoI]
MDNYFSAITRPAPKIQFIGAFDTVKAVNDRSLYDISFNESIQHTHASKRETGSHDVNEGFTTPERPDLIIHDSGGFEAGGSDELEAVKKFCIELNSSQVKQKAAIELFSIISLNAENVPIVIVGTKKDKLTGAKDEEARRKSSKPENQQTYEDFQAFDA